MAYGTPETLEEVEPYLRDIRGGRPTPPALVEEIRRRYAAIGGRSPLLEITRAQARALEALLNDGRDEGPFAVYVGMRHWHPYIHEAVRQIAADGVHTVVALCLAPYASRLSTGAYFARVREAVEMLGQPLEVRYAGDWHTHPRFIAAIVERVQNALERLEREGGEPPYLLFTAHSLPVSVVAQGDPYDAQLRETTEQVVRALGIAPDRWQFCYQSAGASAGPWLGPPLVTVIEDLVRAGQRNFLIVPIGFVSDHVEVLYDIDIEARGVAERLGARLSRTVSLNTSPPFIEALADVVRRAVGIAR
ncbi:MAG: ferrochelatase [Chloroflexi bacterium]|nr:ferrochelatase [Chloroflexota bacterium]